MNDGFCWCDMCGYTAKVKAEDRAKVADQAGCPHCSEVGDQTFLNSGDQIPDHIAADEPMPTWPAT